MQLRTTEWIKVDKSVGVDQVEQDAAILHGARLLQAGQLVAFPTETVYGLGADATSESAVAKIFEAKGRPSDNPLIVHLADATHLLDWVEALSPQGEALIQSFWPGPLTLVMKHNGRLASSVTAGLSTVAVRVPAHPIARALIQQADRPIAAPSANRSGRPSPTHAQHVWKDLQGRIPLLLDGGSSEVGLESTVVDISEAKPMLLRPGGITIEAIEEVIGTISVDPSLHQSSDVQPRSPGMKYKHYAPLGELWLVIGDAEQMISTIQQQVRKHRQAGKRVGVLTTEENKHHYQADTVITAGSRSKPETVAKHLYHALHQLDQQQVEVILSETFPKEGAFYSVMNRLQKAASHMLAADTDKGRK